MLRETTQQCIRFGLLSVLFISACSGGGSDDDKASKASPERETQPLATTSPDDTPLLRSQSHAEVITRMNALIERTDEMLLNAPTSVSLDGGRAGEEVSSTPLARMLDVQQQRFNDLYGRFREAEQALGLLSEQRDRDE